MYRYDDIDRRILSQRVAQYRDQLQRHLAGELPVEEFRPLRLQNGLYMQRHAHMLRIAVPYGLLSATQLRRLAAIARRYDRGYGHFSTRQNLQLNWIDLPDTADILASLAEVEMHAIQTSGNCVRNITTDEFAGVATDEIADPRPLAEILRQWSTFHPEFAFLPRKFKIAISATREDRAATAFHDIGLYIVRSPAGDLGVRVLVGGGMGRTPIIGTVIRDFVPIAETLNYVEAILRVYNRYGRRDNLFKARIKILVKALGAAEFARQVDVEYAHVAGGEGAITEAEFARVAAFFAPPPYASVDAAGDRLDAAGDRAYARWIERNVRAHRVPGYRSVVLSLKKPGVAPGDCTSEQMELVADLSERYGFGELRVTHEQNLVLPDVPVARLRELWDEARGAGLATPNIGLLTDMITCPGGDFCSLANAKSIPISQSVTERFEDLDYLHDLGEINLNISGCMNSCGHHHVGHIGILGVDKDGSEWYQVSIGGADGSDAGGGRTAIGRVLGPSFSAPQVPDVIEDLIAVYVAQRRDGERFIDTAARIGLEPFKARVYARSRDGSDEAIREAA